jgi:PAS domain S-box-containing protein
MIIIIDKNGNVVSLNTKSIKYLFKEKKNLLGKNFRELDCFNQLKHSIFNKVKNVIFKSNKLKFIEFEIISPKDNKQLCLRLESSKLKLNKEEMFLLFLQNITNQRNKEFKLEKLEKKIKEYQNKSRKLNNELETIMERVPALIFYKDTKNNYIRVNKYVADAHGMKKEKLENKSCFEIYPEELAKKYWKDDLEVIRSGIPKLNIEEPWETKEGLKWVLTNKIPYINENKEILGIIGISTNITDRIKAEQKLSKSEKKYRSLIETSPIGLMEIDLTKGGIIYINPQLLEMVGYTKEEFKKQYHFLFANYPEDLTNIKKKLSERNLEFRIINKKGEIKWLAGKTIPYFSEEGNLNTLRIWLQDITERKEIEELKSNLLIRFSHEFKTPLISIKGFTDFLLIDSSKYLNNEAISFLKGIKDGAERLKILVDDFIESTKLKRKLVGLKLKRENITEIIKDALAETEGLIKLRNHTLNMEIHDIINVNCDREKIYSVLINFLQNAIKFTPKGGKIIIQSHISKNAVIISVKDNGIGLKKKEIPKLFKPFGKIEKYGKGWDINTEGIGLGLFYSKEIINLHKGKIWAKSKGKNKGSTFYFSLPICNRN